MECKKRDINTPEVREALDFLEPYIWPKWVIPQFRHEATNGYGYNDVDRKEDAGAVLMLGSPVLNAQRKQVGEFAVKYRLPAIYYTAEFVETGGLMSYGVSRNDLVRRAATYVDKILKGAKPADLPVEQPTKFEFVINLKAAKQIGLTIPPNVLVRADKVIK